MTVQSSQKFGRSFLHFTANATLTIAGNNSVSNVAIGSEIVKGASIKRIWWGLTSGNWTIKRGSNTVFASALGAGHLDFAPTTLSVDSTGTIVIETSGAGFIMLEIQKQIEYGSYTSVY